MKNVVENRIKELETSCAIIEKQIQLAQDKKLIKDWKKELNELQKTLETNKMFLIFNFGGSQ